MSGLLALAWVIAAGVLLGGSGGVALVGLAVGLALVMALALFGPLDSIEVERALPARPLRAGETAVVSLRLHSVRWWPWLTLNVQDGAIQAAAEPAANGIGGSVRLSLLTRRPVTVTYRISHLSRGVYTFGPIRIVASDPFGLVRRQRTVDIPAELEVWPVPAALEQVRGLLPAAGRSLAMAAGEPRGVRPYLPGDAAQHIHWPATAKTGRPLVRQFDDRQPLALHVAVDAPADANHFERALSEAARVAEWCLRQHCAVAVEVAGAYLPPGRGQVHYQRVMHLLATSQPSVNQDAAATRRSALLGARVVRVSGEVQA